MVCFAMTSVEVCVEKDIRLYSRRGFTTTDELSFPNTKKYIPTLLDSASILLSRMPMFVCRGWAAATWNRHLNFLCRRRTRPHWHLANAISSHPLTVSLTRRPSSTTLPTHQSSALASSEQHLFSHQCLLCAAVQKTHHRCMDIGRLGKLRKSAATGCT